MTESSRVSIIYRRDLSHRMRREAVARSPWQRKFALSWFAPGATLLSESNDSDAILPHVCRICVQPIGWRRYYCAWSEANIPSSLYVQIWRQDEWVCFFLLFDFCIPNTKPFWDSCLNGSAAIGVSVSQFEESRSDSKLVSPS